MAKLVGSLLLFVMLCAPFSFPQGERGDQADPSASRSTPWAMFSDCQRPYLAAEETPKTTNNFTAFVRREPIAPFINSIVSSRLEITAAPVESRIVDWKFGILAALALGSTIADAEVTLHCPQPCREVNPLYGAHPTRARLYGTNAPFLVGEIMLSRLVRKRSPERRLWMIPSLSLTMGHMLGVASNLRAR
jgi:hypothetical protein